MTDHTPPIHFQPGSSSVQRGAATKTRVIRLAGIVLATAMAVVGCGPAETYVVKSIGTVAAANGSVLVVCRGLSEPSRTMTKRWDPVVQVAPVVGEKWLCN